MSAVLRIIEFIGTLITLYVSLGVMFGRLKVVRVRRASPYANPVGWDEKAQRVHDVGNVVVGGQVLHYSTCWCRKGDAA